MIFLTERLVQLMEVALAVGLILSVLAGIVFAAIHLGGNASLWHSQSFQTLIDQALLYIIALEVAVMLIKRDPNIVLDILIFAIARKMIVEISGGLDFFLGAAAILILYVVRWLSHSRLNKIVQREGDEKTEAAGKH